MRQFIQKDEYMHVLREHPIYSVNDIPHITIAHRADVKPRKANDYPQDQWMSLRRKTPIKIAGRLMEVGTVDISRN
jgi:hypothetical protein